MNLLVRGLLAVATRQDQDILPVTANDRSRGQANRQNGALTDNNPPSALHLVTTASISGGVATPGTELNSQ